jgi:hypothetical protein
MNAYARIAWEQDVLCSGWAPERATYSWRRNYGERDAAVREALTGLHGVEALAHARTPYVQRVPCAEVTDPEWALRYERLLRLLEIRLGLTPERRS